MSSHEAEVFNLAEALERVEGDLDLLKEMVDLFLEECPRMLTKIEDAMAANNAQALQNASHTLKGAVSNFAASAATAASFALEKMGREQNLTDSAATLSMLKRELELLSFALEALKEKEAA